MKKRTLILSYLIVAVMLGGMLAACSLIDAVPEPEPTIAVEPEPIEEPESVVEPYPVENDEPEPVEEPAPAEETVPTEEPAAEGQAFVGANGEKMVGIITIKSEWIPFAEPVVLDSIFDNSIVFSGEKAYLLADDQLREYAFDGTTASFIRDIDLGDDYENMQLGDDGTLYFSSFMRPLIGFKDDAKTFSYDGPNDVVMHPSGTWGISFFTGSVPEKITLADGVMQKAPFGEDLVNVISQAFITENYVFLWGNVKDNDRQRLSVFTHDGEFKFFLGYTGEESFQPDSLGAITSVIETENGILALDGNMRNIVLWKPDGTFIGTIAVKELFGTSYPWLSSAFKMPDRSIIIGLAQERDDETADEFLLYRISGF